MVTVEEAEQQIQQRRQELAEAQRQQEAAQAQIEKAKQVVESQKFRRQMSGIQGLRERQKIQANLSQARQDLLTRSQAIQQADSQLTEVQNQINQARGIQTAENEAYRDALKAYETGRPEIAYFSGKKASRIYRDMVENRNSAIQGTLQNLESQGVDETTLAEIEKTLKSDVGRVASRQVTAKVQNMLDAKYNSQTVDLPTVEKIQTLGPQFITGVPSQSPSLTGGQGVITRAPEETRLQKYVRETDQLNNKGKSGPIRNILGFGAGAVLKGVDTVKAIPKIPEAIRQTAKNPGFALLSVRNSINEYPSYLQNNPIKATSSIFFDVVAFKGSGKLAELGTKGIYKAANLPKTNTLFLSEQSVSQGENILLKTALDSEVAGVIRTKRYLAAAETVVQKNPLDENVVRSATRGISREQKFWGGYKEPVPFRSLGQNVLSQTELTLNRKYPNGINIQSMPKAVTFSEGYSKTAVGNIKPKYSENLYFAVEGDKKTAIIGTSKEFVRQDGGYLYGNKKYLPGQEKSFGYVQKAEMPSESNIISGGNLGTTKKPVNTAQIAKDSTQTAATIAAKEQFVSGAAKQSSKTVQSSEVLGSPVSSLKSEQSLFYAKGSYEKTKESQGVSQIFFQKSQDNNIQASLNLLKNRQNYRQSPSEILQPGQNNIPKANLFFKAREILRQRQNQRTVQRQVSRQVQGTKYAMKSKLSFFAGNRNANSSWDKPKVYKDDFELFSFKSGKEFLFSKASNLRQALFKAKKFVDSNLRASFKIRRNGEAINLSNINLLGYRASKRDKTRLVQESKRRLSSGGERKEIQFFRKSKNKRNIWGI